MLRATQRPIPSNALSQANPAALGMFSAMDAVAGRDRQQAALDAHHWGLIDDDALRFAFTVTDDRGTPSATKKKRRGKQRKKKSPNGIESLNRLLAEALNASDNNERMAVFQKAFVWGKQAGRIRSTLALFTDLLSQITPSSERADFAELAIRASLLLGDQAPARSFGMRKLQPTRPRRWKYYAANWRLILFSVGPKRKNLAHRGIINRWWLNELAQGTKNRFERGALIASLFDALGEQTSNSLWRALYEGPTRENTMELSAALRRDLRRAAQNKRLGEAVLIILIALQDDGMARLGAGSLSDLVSALTAVGLKKGSLCAYF